MAGAIINKNGSSLTINNPAIGWWTAVVAINDNYGSQPYTLTVTGQRFKALTGVTITPSSFTLASLGTQSVTVTDSPTTPSGLGMIIFYDFATGSTYARTLMYITH
jgi:hypothetical protein